MGRINLINGFMSHLQTIFTFYHLIIINRVKWATLGAQP